MMTADEIAMAGGGYQVKNLYAYCYLNSIGGSVTGSKLWRTMSPASARQDASSLSYTGAGVFSGTGTNGYVGSLGIFVCNNPDTVVRPVLSLKSCVVVSRKWNSS